MNTAEKFVRERLFSMADPKYRDFNSALIPNIEKSAVIGVRTPELRKFAKEFARNTLSAEFSESLPHRYLEENHLHAFLLEQIKDFDRLMSRVEVFLPYIDNWATCDGFSPPVFKRNTDRLLPYIEKWLKSQHTYTVRFGIVNLMRHYLDGDFKPEYLTAVSRVDTEDYYLSMAVAWYFATALAKQYEATLPFIESKVLDAKTHNKTIQKAVESFRLTDTQKQYLKTLKVK